MKSSRNTARQLFGLTLTLVGLMSWNILPLPHPELTVRAANRPKVAEPTGQQVSRAGANGRVAFVSSEGNARSDIYTMNPDGGNVQRLTNNPAYDQGPKWSPDGTKIAFTSSRDDTSVGCTSGGGCKHEIYVMNADGTNQTRTNNTGFFASEWFSSIDDSFDWSPDGTRIVFESSHDGSFNFLGISVMNADGSNVRRLTNYPGYDYSPKWSPDGTKIAFGRADDVLDQGATIYVMNADGTNQTRLTDLPGLDQRWSSDGTKIVFVSVDIFGEGSREIYVTNADGSNVQRLTNNPTADADPRWSPDGTKITFVRRRVGTPQCPSGAFCSNEIYVMNANGTNQTRLTDSPAGDHSPIFSPDGTKIAFISHRDNNAAIYVMNADGSSQTRLTNAAAVAQLDWQALTSPSCPNPIDCADFFVRQHYRDFLGREPDPAGMAGWLAVLNNCLPGDAACDRIHVSSAFFRSPEFQERGYFLYRFYSVAFGRKPDFNEFTPDLAKVSGFLTDAELEAAKVAFIAEFMNRPAFLFKFNGLSNTEYVDALLVTADITHPSRDLWIAALTSGSRTRAQVLREIAESAEVYNKYYNQAFVVMQYFGYLRRQPDALYLNWIAHLDGTGDYSSMISGFINSVEYRQRFGP